MAARPLLRRGSPADSRSLTIHGSSRTYEFMRIVWDEAKRQANLTKHGLDFADLDVDFFADAIFRPAHSGRLQALGRLDGGCRVSVVFRPLGSEAVSVISMRPASSIEREIYDETL